MQANILVVDDTPENLQLLVGILTAQDYKVRPASNGRRALAAIQAEHPDLILLDIKMPDMSGYEVCKQIKTEPSTQDIPVIFISALDEVTEKVKGFALGGVDYITKPFQAEEVLVRVKTHLTLHRLRNHLGDLVQERTAELEQEITEHQQTEQALRASEQQYRFLLENVAEGIGIIQDGTLVFVNDVLAAMLDCPTEQLLRETPLDVCDRSYRRIFKDIQEQFEQQQNNSQWYVLEHAVAQNDREVWIESRHSGILWEGKTALLIIMRDITERKQKEEELKNERKQLLRENVRLRSAMKERYRFGDLIGKSSAMQEVYELIAKASASDAPVVIYGESGTGKDLVAQTIHQMSNRRKKPFIPVNCGSIQETLFESEFFGYRKGAFTGALRDKPGFFDVAHQGILFLDEVGELPLAMQVKLLRAIEGKGYTPVGDHKVKHADVRIIAATNRNMAEQIKEGLIREDFFYRINVIRINVPPLRDRKEDIPLLVEHFLTQHGDKTPQPILPGNVLALLYQRDWPGNIRQLQNVLQRYLTLERLDFADELPGEDNAVLLPEMLLKEGKGIRAALEDVEKRLVMQTLTDCQGNISRTAKILGIPRRTLRRKIEKYQI